MNSPKPRSFMAQVRAALPSLHPSERRLAEVVLNFPGELASYSASELARLAHVSNATVTRFVRKVGYASFEEARQAARDGAHSGAALFRVAPERDAPEAALTAHLQQGLRNLEQTFATIHQAEIDTIARALLEAPRVWIIGFRTSQAFAQYMGSQLRQVIEDISVLPGPGQTLAEALASIRAGDCVIVFALRRPVRALDAVVGEIGRSGARMVLIGDEGMATRTGVDWAISCQTTAPGPLFNHVAVLGLCHFIATRTLEQAGVAGRRRLSLIESLHDSLGEL